MINSITYYINENIYNLIKLKIAFLLNVGCSIHNYLIIIELNKKQVDLFYDKIVCVILEPVLCIHVDSRLSKPFFCTDKISCKYI